MKKGFPSLLFQSVARVGMDLPFFVKMKPRYRPKCPPHGRKDEEKGGVRSTFPCDKSFERKMAVFFFFHHVYLACSSKRPVFFGLWTRLPCWNTTGGNTKVRQYSQIREYAQSCRSRAKRETTFSSKLKLNQSWKYHRWKYHRWNQSR